MVRAVVKSGHWDEFVAADKAWQEAATRVGFPTYRTYSSNWGTFNEVFGDAEYESSADIEARFAAADKDPAYDAALKAWLSHVVDGESRDYVLSEVVE
ncbi:MAG: NIPSNAP family protein [Candidatus Limnocylindrales bacterium]